MMPPRPLRLPAKSPTKTIFETITSAASSIPGLIHDGLSSLSGYGQAFEDELAFPKPTESQVSNKAPKPPADSQPAGSQHHQVTSSYTYAQSPDDLTEGEALEFFRKRPHLLKNRGKKTSSFLSPEYSSGTEQS